MDVNALPEYENPPVAEVVCGVLFKNLSGLLAPYLGLLWEEFRQRYPTCEEAPPIIPAIETFGDQPASTKTEFVEIPPLPRVWYVQEGGTGLVQVQRDRFLYNWRKMGPGDVYPRFERVFGEFDEHLRTFDSFVQTNRLGEVAHLQYELTYVNHVRQGEGWSTHADLGKVFADFAWRVKGQRFLPAPEHINWRTTFLLPSQCGRLHMTVRDAVHPDQGRSLYVFELTARGMPGITSRENMREWFDMAHEWIVRGFTDLTDETTQLNVWGRTK